MKVSAPLDDWVIGAGPALIIAFAADRAGHLLSNHLMIDSAIR
jgi:hypothetical protein